MIRRDIRTNAPSRMKISCHCYLSLRKVEGTCMYGWKVRYFRGCQCGEGEGHFFYIQYAV
jgi:hypothetical protein